MRKLLRFSVFLAFVGLFFAGPAAASHLQGGDLTYASLGNNRYRVTLHLYRDCSGILPSPFTLECRNGGCNSAVAVTAPFVQVGSPVAGRQYCATLSGVCASGGPVNSEAYTYTADVTLPPAARWILSTNQNARPSTTNLANAGDLYWEATLNNLIPVSGTTGLAIANNSPVASALPVCYIPWNRLSTVSNSVFDVDGDSLVYSMDSPLEACNTPVTYAPYPTQPMTTIGTNPSCFLQFPNVATYSANLPVLVAVDTVGACPIKTGVPRFFFNPSNGNIQLQPSRYVATTSASGDNKYAAVVKISEYRRINGSYVLVGTMRRELYFIVYDCGTNILPRMASTVTIQTGIGTGTQNTVQPAGQAIPVLAGEPVSVIVTATDANANQVVALNLDYNTTPGAALQNLGNGQARLTFTPPLTLPSGTYRVTVTAEDNACPIKGLDSQTLTFRVSSGAALATRTGAALAVEAYPNPFTDQVQFKLAKSGIQTLTICDNLGRTVANVRSEADGTVRWQPGAEVPAGLYLARTANGTQTVRLLRSAQ